LDKSLGRKFIYKAKMCNNPSTKDAKAHHAFFQTRFKIFNNIPYKIFNLYKCQYSWYIVTMFGTKESKVLFPKFPITH